MKNRPNAPSTVASRRRGTIAHILPFAEIGGTELQTLRVAQIAESFGFRNVIYHPAEAPQVENLFEHQGFATKPYNQVQPSFRKPMPYWRASRDLARDLRREHTGIVHCADILAAYFAGFAARLAGAKVLCHVRNPYRTISKRDRSFLYTVNQFIFISQAVKEALDVPAKWKSGPVVYDVPGALLRKASADSTAARIRLGIPTDALVVGTAARLAPQKDYATLIRAAQVTLKSVPNVHFIAAGDTDRTSVQRNYFAALQPILDETGTRDRFHFIGFQRDMTDFYGAIDAFALSSNWEGLGSALLEAVYQRKPIVATCVDGVPEVILDGKTGLLAPPQSPEIMGKQLIRVLSDKNLATELVANALAHAEANFGPERFRNQLETLYSQW